MKNQKISLRHIKLSDAKDYFESYKNKEAEKGFITCLKSLLEAKKDIKWRMKEYKKDKNKRSHEMFVIEVNGAFAGWIDIHSLNVKHEKHKAVMGYGISKKFMGGGIATEAVKMITKYTFKEYKLKRLSGWCRTYNKASAKVLEKAGYKLEGILRKNKFKDGKYLDDMVWTKVK